MCTYTFLQCIIFTHMGVSAGISVATSCWEARIHNEAGNDVLRSVNSYVSPMLLTTFVGDRVMLMDLILPQKKPQRKDLTWRSAVATARHPKDLPFAGPDRAQVLHPPGRAPCLCSRGQPPSWSQRGTQASRCSWGETTTAYNSHVQPSTLEEVEVANGSNM